MGRQPAPVTGICPPSKAADKRPALLWGWPLGCSPIDGEWPLKDQQFFGLDVSWVMGRFNTKALVLIGAGSAQMDTFVTGIWAE